MMTAEEILIDLVARPTLEIRSAQTGQILTTVELTDEARKLIGRIRHGESKRCAGCAEIVAQLNEVAGGPASPTRWQGHAIATRFREYAQDILATSPGKGDG